MKKIMAVLAGVSLLAMSSIAQTNIVLFTNVTVTGEKAVQLTWTSVPHELYQIQYANALATNTDGSTAWQVLYDDYPSQGTNTFIGDFGNYYLTPAVVHPKLSAMRFYRVVDIGQDGLTNNEPIISINSPTNGSSLTGLVSIDVTAQSDQDSVYTELYIDGQEMNHSISTTNYNDGATNYRTDTYVINTCEWANGSHVLYAIAKAVSGLTGAFGTGATQTGYSVSQMIPVEFDNLVTSISFSEPFFQPDLGQTQIVSAVFAAHSDWTLVIRDINSNAVRTITGSGNTMSFAWDGNGDGETNLPAGVYHYYVSASTNGLTDEIVTSNDDNANINLSPLPDEEQLYIVDDYTATPLAIYPPNFATNKLNIISATPMQVEEARQSLYMAGRSFIMNDSVFSPNVTIIPPSQNGPPAPLRPPNYPINKAIGTVGVAYQDYSANGDAGFSPTRPKGSQGPNLGTINMEGSTTQPVFKPLPNSKLGVLSFIYEMGQGGWVEKKMLANDQLTAAMLTGTGLVNPFNLYDIGVLDLHCVYGSSMDFEPIHPCQQMYYPITHGTSSQYVRFSDMQFGGVSPGFGLKWMALLACSSLNQANWTSMQNQKVKPYNSNLRMILGADTEFCDSPEISQYWADYMIGDLNTNRPPKTIRESWYQAASDAFHFSGDPHYQVPVMRFAVACNKAAYNDYLQNSSNTNYDNSTDNWRYETVQVYP